MATVEIARIQSRIDATLPPLRKEDTGEKLVPSNANFNASTMEKIFANGDYKLLNAYMTHELWISRSVRSMPEVYKKDDIVKDAIYKLYLMNTLDKIEKPLHEMILCTPKLSEYYQTLMSRRSSSTNSIQ